MANIALYRFRVPEAARLASLAGIENDLRGVQEYCDLLLTKGDERPFASTEWEAISSAGVVRYARCFCSGVRHSLSRTLFDDVDSEFYEAHELFIDMRNKHVAHSVNEFEENDAVVQISDEFRSSEEIKSVTVAHGRVSGMSFQHPETLKAVCEWLLRKVRDEMDVGKPKILEQARKYPLKELMREGVPGPRLPEAPVNRSRRRL